MTVRYYLRQQQNSCKIILKYLFGKKKDCKAIFVGHICQACDSG